MEDRHGDLVTVYSIKVSKYLTPWAERGIGMVGQPTAHYLFHRPLHLIFNAGFRAGFVLDGLQEPTDPAEPNASRWSAWSNYKETPPALVARLRLDRCAGSGA